MDIAGRPPDATAASTACLSKRASCGTPDAVGFAADLTDPACVSDLIEQVGDVEVLVTNAGMASLGVLTGQLIVIDGGNSVMENKGHLDRG